MPLSHRASECCLKLQRQRGVTFLGLLLGVALLGVGLTAASEVWVTAANRQRHAQAEWAAREFTRAIGSFYESSPAGVKRFPRTVDDLLEDRRAGGVARRHLRQIYLNPYTAKREWDWLTAPDGGVMGLRLPPREFGLDLPSGRDFVYAPL
jgi:type II secretory pathway pseudopilin PulG